MSFSASLNVGFPPGMSSRFEVSSNDGNDFNLHIGRDNGRSFQRDGDAPRAGRQQQRPSPERGETPNAKEARSEQFLEDVKTLDDSSSKRALIDNFVNDALEENNNPERGGDATPAKPAPGKTAPAKTDAPTRAPNQGGNAGYEPTMKGLQGLAKTVDTAEDLPENTQNNLLDDIAGLATQIKDASDNGGDVRRTALLGLSDLAKTLDESEGSDGAKGPVMDQIADLISNVATGNFDSAPDAGAPAPSDDSAPSGMSDGTTGPWTHSVKDGKAEINLGDKYTITAQEDGEAWTVKNNETGAVTKISGDPHVDVGNDGKNDWDFKKDMTFQLDDGTKISVGTVPADNGTTYSSELTITNGDKAMRVTGLAGDHDGKNNLEVIQSDEGGASIDSFTPDGFVVTENGSNWTSRLDGATITQAIINNAEKTA